MTQRRLKVFRFYVEFLCALFGYAIAYLGLGYLSILTRREPFVPAPSDAIRLLVSSVVINMTVFVGAASIIQVMFNRKLIRLTLKRHNLGESATSVATGVLILIAISFFMGMLMSGILPKQEIDPAISAIVEYFRSVRGGILIAVLAMIFVAGIPEEYFRSYVLSFSLRKGTIWLKTVSLIVVSLLFALGHMYQGFLAVVQIFPIGLYIGWFYMKRQNLWEVILLHALYNASALFLSV